MKKIEDISIDRSQYYEGKRRLIAVRAFFWRLFPRLASWSLQRRIQRVMKQLSKYDRG